MNVNALPPYALTAAGDNDASKGTSEASSVNKNVVFRTPSRADHETCVLDERGNAAGSSKVTNVEEELTASVLNTEALVKTPE